MPTRQRKDRKRFSLLFSQADSKPQVSTTIPYDTGLASPPLDYIKCPSDVLVEENEITLSRSVSSATALSISHLHGPGDSERTNLRYQCALSKLETALRLPRNKKWELFQITRFLHTRRNAARNQGFWQNGKALVERVFNAVAPLAKNLLIISGGASGMSGINPLSLFSSGVFLLISIADQEVSKREEVAKQLDYISRQLGMLEIIEKLPAARVKTESLVNRATDVLSASLSYLAAHISQESGRLGLLGSIVSTFLKGSKEFDSVYPALKASVDEFNAAVSHFGHEVGFETFDMIQSVIRDDRIERERTTSGSEDRFIVPYHRNNCFTGRKDLLSKLRNMLCDETPKQWNHRVALYGLGGVGKTQLALEYVHSLKAEYSRVYWISAVSESTLWSGLQDIGIKTGWISQNANLSLKDVATTVLKKLNEEEKWLIVFDNLDDVEVADGYLPDIARGKHTLITTRNRHCHHIPAEALEVSMLERSEAIDLLLTRSGFGERPDLRTEAAHIVEELGCLPLAIEQAAAYIRETLRDIFKYRQSYQRNQKMHHERISKANRNYYEKSIATTWNMSLNQLNPAVVNVLRLLAFLNPDGILTDFLEAGAEGVSEELANIFSDPDRLFETLGDLERFSLVRRQNDVAGGQLITMHRLLQFVVKDNMPPDSFLMMEKNVIGLCRYGFPYGDLQHHPTLLKCRRFHDQAMIPLLSCSIADSPPVGCLLHRLGRFLITDGKYRQAIELLKRAKLVKDTMLGRESPYTNVTADLAWAYYEDGSITESVDLAEKVYKARIDHYGVDHAATLSSMGGLAGLYWAQGRYQTAADLQVKVVETSKKLLGDEHPETWRAIETISLIYNVQGRWKESAEIQEMVLEARKRDHGEDHLLTYNAMGNLSASLQYQKRFEAARELQEGIVNGRLKLLGAEHPFTCGAQMALGTTYAECGRLTEAVDTLKTAIDGLSRTVGTKHQLTLIGIANLGYVYSELGDWSRSIFILENVKSTTARLFGCEHPYTLWMNSCLADVFYRQHKLKKSIDILETVLEAQRRVLGHGHPMTVSNEKRLSVWKGDFERSGSPIILFS